MADIYQDLWNADRNGLSVGTRNAAGGFTKPDADILIDKQAKASGKRQLDLATAPLFFKVNEAKLERPTYRSFVTLLDNYVANVKTAEVATPEEEQEETRLLDATAETEVFELGRTYVNQTLGEALTPKAFHAALRRIWFEMYVNHFGGDSVHFASGFEHVFVGEAKYSQRFGRQRTLGEISGYHSWVKFHLDEASERVNFLGYKYDLQGDEGVGVPNVITMQMLWYLSDVRGRVVAELFKKKGGFFVGPSPECELVMGAVAFYESRHGMLRNERRRTTINGAQYDLVLYRSTTREGDRGDHIRSFYPEYLGGGEVEGGGQPDIDDPIIIDVPSGAARVAITAALVNPKGDDVGKEWVELTNRSGAKVDLAGWELRDREGRPEPLEGSLGPNEKRQVRVRRTTPNSMQLGNNGGAIVLFDGREVVTTVNYKKAPQGEVLAFPG